MALLEITNISKYYQKYTEGAVNGISLSINQGEIIGLTGESGGGKTTLLKLIYGIEEPDSGEIKFNNEKILGPNDQLIPGHNKMQMIFQSFQLLPYHKVYQNIEYYLRGFTTSDKKERLEFLLEVCKLGNLRDKYPKELSGGQQQRVAIAKALAAEPELILMDEPFSSLDLITKRDVKVEIFDILRRVGTTVVFATHDTQDALSLSDRIAVLKEGKLLQYDTPENIYSQPESSYVSNLFGLTNVFDKSTINNFFPNFKEVKENGLIGIRAENIKIKEGTTNLKGKIVRKKFIGAQYELRVIVEEHLQITLFTENPNHQVGDVVPLSLNLDKIIKFKNPSSY